MTPDGLAERLVHLPSRGRRFVVAIAGPPASGKTTLAASIADAMPGRAAVLGLDAFHFDDAILFERGQRARKGAPWTFDVGGYRRCLHALIDNLESDIAIPVFDRDLELARNGAAIVSPTCDVIITEGNYLLLDDGDWPSLAPLFDLTVFLQVPMPTVRERILARWHHHGLSADEAEVRADENDIPNAELVLERSRPGDHLIYNE